MLFLFIFVSAVFAETSIKAEVNKDKITTDEAATYKLTVTSSETKISPPVLPKFEGFAIFSNVQSSSITLSEGKAKTQIVYASVLIPQKTGKLKIGPASIKINNQTYASNALEIEVTQGKNKPQPQIPSASEEPQTTL